NFWDTDNNEEKEDFDEDSGYNLEDWEFYKSLGDEKPETNPKRLTFYSGAKNKYFNIGADGSSGGDGLHILSPTLDLVTGANECGEYNDCSYVLLYKTGDDKIVFAGDSHDKCWEHILETHKDVKNIDLLMAPHHGRASQRCYDFLDVLKPKM